MNLLDLFKQYSPFRAIPSNFVVNALGGSHDYLPPPMNAAVSLGEYLFNKLSPSDKRETLDDLSKGKPSSSCGPSGCSMNPMNYHPANVIMDKMNIGTQYRGYPPPLRIGGSLLSMFRR